MVDSYHRTDVREDHLSTCELDSYANTSVAGRNFALILEPTRTVTVYTVEIQGGVQPTLTKQECLVVFRGIAHRVFAYKET
jgi:hypothetical protein